MSSRLTRFLTLLAFIVIIRQAEPTSIGQASGKPFLLFFSSRGEASARLIASTSAEVLSVWAQCALFHTSDDRVFFTARRYASNGSATNFYLGL